MIKCDLINEHHDVYIIIQIADGLRVAQNTFIFPTFLCY